MIVGASKGWRLTTSFQLNKHPDGKKPLPVQETKTYDRWKAGIMDGSLATNLNSARCSSPDWVKSHYRKIERSYVAPAFYFSTPNASLETRWTQSQACPTQDQLLHTKLLKVRRQKKKRSQEYMRLIRWYSGKEQVKNFLSKDASYG